ncbi:Response regulator PleD [Pseudidiomarina piscicola]|uniref:diguanylate cyclase n=1 Tax=Pseudidiomarina piscicola TaxID=2614830 RepID=A0A6S6WP16_9GAMM|nr:GGDEF domain-containing protein [Pseudidiomarina piscicola]CAB0151346.1 Response regulator PleD [Pseudidiomarina piscicola]VZT40827.1 Response regulator PleD [Pseudomonas aeruginosa]
MTSMDRNVGTHDRPQFWRVAQRCCLIAASVDIAFFAIFLVLDSPILAWVNVISVAMYGFAHFAYGRRLNWLAGWLVWTEVLLHAALGIILIGWDSGFHYYLLMFIPALAVTMTVQLAVIALILLWLYYVGLYAIALYYPPIQPITEPALIGVNLFNLTIVFSMFSYLGFFYVRTVSSAHRKLNRLASTDALTLLHNRRHLTELAETEITRAERYHKPLTLLLIDIDHFKLINDIFGHVKGDEVLQHLAQLIRLELRQHDLIGRWGGEEFLVVLPETDINTGEQVAERIRVAISRYDWSQNLKKDLAVTLSVGLSQLGENETLTRLINRADKALYASKSAGRNRVTAL